MGKTELQQFYIVLNKIDAVYGAGETVSGRCIIALNGVLDTSQLEIKLKGRANVRWTEPRGNSAEVYSKKHSFIDFSFRPQMNTIISKGEHIIPFTFQLPTSSIASSFIGKYGSIKYWIKAIIHESGILSSNHKATLPLFIFAPPCVSITETQASVQKSNEKRLGFFTSDLVKMTARIDRVGQTLGTSVSILCTVENNSRKKITPRVTLKQRQIFHVRRKKKCHKESVIRVEGNVVEPEKSVTEALVLQVPHELPILYNQCPIIEVNYHIRVTLDIPGSLNLHVDLPVILLNRTVNFDTD